MAKKGKNKGNDQFVKDSKMNNSSNDHNIGNIWNLDFPKVEQKLKIIKS
jgi:hypothetical protein